MKLFLILFTQKGEIIPINFIDYKSFQDQSKIILIKFRKKRSISLPPFMNTFVNIYSYDKSLGTKQKNMQKMGVPFAYEFSLN